MLQDPYHVYVVALRLGNLTFTTTWSGAELVHSCTSLVYIAQVAPRCIHHVSDDDFREQPVRWHDGTQLGNQINTNSSI